MNLFLKLGIGLALSSWDRNIVYAAGSEHVEFGVFRSTDGGNSWQDFSQGLLSKRVSRIAIDATSGTMYAGTLGYGVYKRRIAPGRVARPGRSPQTWPGSFLVDPRE